MKKKFKSVIAVILLILIFAIPVNTTNINTSAAKEPTISTKEEFFKAISKQISDRTLYKSYTLDSSLYGWLVDEGFYDEYLYHYDSDNPLMSGCYLGNYLIDFKGECKMPYDSNTCTAWIRITFPYPKPTMDSHFNKMSELAESLKGKDDYETVKNIHDYLIKNFDYDYRKNNENYTDIEGFRDGVMVCNGYAMATFYLCNKAGIDARLIIGIGGNDTTINHAWNVVKIDGNWYNMDVTWDDQGGDKISYKYFLKSDADFPLHVRSNHYNSSTFGIEISKTSYKAASSKQYLLIFVFLIVCICILLIIKNNSKARAVVSEVDKNQYSVGTVKEDDFDKWLNENQNTSTSA